MPLSTSPNTRPQTPDVTVWLKSSECCWTCQYLINGGKRFVFDFECNHPENKPQDDPRPVFLDPEELDAGCPLWESE